MITLYFDLGHVDIMVDDNSFRYRKIMGENELTLYFSLRGFLEIPIGAYCYFENERYELIVPQNFKKHGPRIFEYTLILESAQSLLKKYKFKDTNSNRLKFSLTAKPIEHLQMLVANLNLRDSDWTVGTCIDASEKVLSYNHDYCSDAIKMIAEAFETEWEIVGKTINLQKNEYNKSTPLALSYGRGNGFKPGVGRMNADNSKPIEILYVQGGNRNIDKSTYGASELFLPKAQTLVYEGRTYITDADGLSVKRQDKALSTYEEGSIDLSNIYPSRVGSVSSVVVVDLLTNKYDFIDSSIPNDMDFEALLVAGETLTVIFQTGMLTAKEFDVKYIHADRRFEIVPQEIDGQPMPNETYKPRPASEGYEADKYIVLGISLPTGYVCNDALKTGASWEMFTEAVEYLFENEDHRFNFIGELDSIWAKQSWDYIGPKIKLGGYVNFSDSQFQAGILVRISGIKDFINDPHSPVIDLSNLVTKANVNSDLHKISETKVELKSAKIETTEYVNRKHNSIIDFTDEKIHHYKIRKLKIPFTASETPQITNYNANYAAIYGQDPDVRLYTVDESGNLITRSELPYFILDVNGLIGSISFGTLADGPQNGFIKIQ